MASVAMRRATAPANVNSRLQAGSLTDLLASAAAASRPSPRPSKFSGGDGGDEVSTTRPSSGTGNDDTDVVRNMSKELAMDDMQAAERPQMLAQLAKDISDLIHSSRGSASDRRASQRVSASPATLRHKSLEAGTATSATTMPSAISANMTHPPLPHFNGSTTAGSSRTTLQTPSLAPASAVSEPVEVRPTSAGRSSAGRFSFDVPTTRLQPEPHMQDVGSGTRARSPHEVHTLLTSIENREEALRLKVQQLTEEKTLQQRCLEEEVARLQRSNARMEEELRNRQDMQVSREVQLSGDVRPITHQTGRPEGMDEIRSGTRTPAEMQECRMEPLAQCRVEPLAQPQDAHEEVQQQLAEIRSEVAKCARALYNPEPLPSAEVFDIRQQLSALSGEVIATSRALLTGPPNNGARDVELAEVRKQLEALQSQVSRAMSAAMSRPVEPQELADPRAAEISELMTEVSTLRAEMARSTHGMQPQTWRGYGQEPVTQGRQPGQPLADLSGQIEALRLEMRQLKGQTPVHHMGQANQHDMSQMSRQAWVPQAGREHTPEVASLHSRLSSLRSEVARVVQDQRQVDESASPELRSQLGALLQELHDVRSGAAAVAAAANGGARWPYMDCGATPERSPSPRALDIAVHNGLANDALHPGRGRSCTPRARFMDAGPCGNAAMNPEWAASASRLHGATPMAPPMPPYAQCGAPHAASGTSLYVCPHLAANLGPAAGGRPVPGYGYGQPFSEAAEPVALQCGRGSAVPSRPPAVTQPPQRPSSSGPASARSWGRPTDGPRFAHGPGGPRNGGSGYSSRGLPPAAVSGMPFQEARQMNSPETQIAGPPGREGWRSGTTERPVGALPMPEAAWPNVAPAKATAMRPSMTGSPDIVNLCGDVSLPAVEPADHAPQGAMQRPMRTKIPCRE